MTWIMPFVVRTSVATTFDSLIWTPPSRVPMRTSAPFTVVASSSSTTWEAVTRPGTTG